MAANISRGIRLTGGCDVTVVTSVTLHAAAPYFGDSADLMHLRMPYHYVHSQTIKAFFPKHRILGRLLAPVGLVLDATIRQANYWYIWRLGACLRKLKPSVVHINNGIEAITAVPDDVPIVYHLHGPVPKVLPANTRALLGKVTHFIAISGYVAQSYIAAGLDPARMSVVSNFVLPRSAPAMDVAEARRALGVPGDRNVVGLVGRIVPWKGTREFIEAMILVIRRFPGTQVLLVGDASEAAPEYVQSIRDQITAAGITEQVTFISHVSDPYVVYRACDVVAHTSIEPEPFGMVIIEAMQAGTAVVAAATGGGPTEIVRHRENGMLESPLDPERYAGCVMELLENSHLRNSLAAAGQATVAERYGHERSTGEILRIYRDVISAKSLEPM